MPRGNQLIRQWSILNLIEAHRFGITIDILAGELKCNIRTVRRDLDALLLTGFPIYDEKVDDEVRWKILNEFTHAPHTPFTLIELLSLYFSRNLLKVLKGTEFYLSLESALDKIRKTIKPETLEHLGKIEKTFYVGKKRQKDYGHYKGFLDNLMNAAANTTTVEMTYHSMNSGKTALRKVDPYKIWYFDNTFFLIGRCHRHDEVRMFVVDRIKKLNATEEIFRISADFSIEEYMKHSFGVIHDKKVTVVIHFDEDVARYIMERTWHESQKIKKHQDGSVTITLTVAGTNEIKYWALSWGQHAEILKPQSLREEIKKDLSSALQHY